MKYVSSIFSIGLHTNIHCNKVQCVGMFSPIFIVVVFVGVAAGGRKPGNQISLNWGRAQRHHATYRVQCTDHIHSRANVQCTLYTSCGVYSLCTVNLAYSVCISVYIVHKYILHKYRGYKGLYIKIPHLRVKRQRCIFSRTNLLLLKKINFFISSDAIISHKKICRINYSNTIF